MLPKNNVMNGFPEGKLLENRNRRKKQELRNWEARAKPRTWARSVIAVALTDKNRVNKTESMMAFARQTWRRFAFVVVMVYRLSLCCDLSVFYCNPLRFFSHSQLCFNESSKVNLLFQLSIELILEVSVYIAFISPSRLGPTS